jgi:hypothetical protein
MYDPGIGRWLQLDPMGFEPRDANLYRYVHNDLPNSLDPSGLEQIQKKNVAGEDAVRGKLAWNIYAPDAKGKTVIAMISFLPSEDNTSNAILYIQVIRLATHGGKAVWPGAAGDADFYKNLCPSDRDREIGGNHVDLPKGRKNPIFGGAHEREGSGGLWVHEDPLVQRPDGKISGRGRVGFGKSSLAGKKLGYGRSAVLMDEPGTDNARKGKELVMKFESAAFSLDTHEVLGVLTWGFKVPGNQTDDISLDEPRFSKEPSEDFRRAVKQANETLPFKIHEPRAIEGSPLMGGSSALPKK